MKTINGQFAEEAADKAREFLAKINDCNVGRGHVMDSLLDLYNATSKFPVGRSLVVAGLEELPGKHLVPTEWWQGLLEALIETCSEAEL